MSDNIKIIAHVSNVNHITKYYNTMDAWDNKETRCEGYNNRNFPSSNSVESKIRDNKV